MDSSNLRAAQGQAQIPGQVMSGEAVTNLGIEGGDWRAQLQPDDRLRLLNKILETLKRHLPFSGPEGLQELRNISVRFEEKVYTAATSQRDYFRKISLEMLKMESQSQHPITKFIQSNGVSDSRNLQYPVFSQVKMESSNWRAAPGHAQIPGQVMSGEAVANLGMEGAEWRTQLQPDYRLRIGYNVIMETLKIHLPFSGPLEIKNIAVRFEEKMYTQATSQKDYLRRISFKMLTLESQSRNPVANSAF